MFIIEVFSNSITFSNRRQNHLTILIILLLCVQVKKMFAQVVIAMAHHGYLELEGGQLMVEFIIRQCALPPDPAVSSNYVTRIFW